MLLTEISCSYHDHALVLKKHEVPCRCDGCKGLVFSPCYECKDEKCNFHLHLFCALLDHPFFHKFFRKHKFEFHKTAPGSEVRDCDACAKPMQGFTYQCRCAKYDLHPHCAKLPHELPSKDGSQIFHLREKASSSCLKCKMKVVSDRIEGWCYVSSCGTYCCHVRCVEEILLEDWENNKEQIASSLALRSQEVAGTMGKRSSSTGGKAKKIAKNAALILSAIVSGIFGEPITFGVAVAQLVFSN